MHSTTITVTTLASLLLLSACGSDHGITNNNSADLHACPGQAPPSLTALPVGGVAVFAPPVQLGCLTIGTLDASNPAASYLVIAADANPLPDSTAQYAIVDSSATATVADRVGTRTSLARNVSLAPMEHLASDAGIRAMERRVLHLDRPAAVHAAHVMQANRVLASRVRAAVVPTPGDTLTLKVPDPNATDACTTFDTVKAVVKVVGTHGIIAQDVQAPANGFTSTDFSSISNEFDSIIYATDTVHFGGPTDIDGNARVILLYTPKVNAATKRTDQSFIGGFFFGGDLFPTTGPSACPESNLAELFYLIVPDPTGQFSSAHSASSVRQLTRGIIAHEFQHMINEGTRINEDAPGESVWLNEGLSHFAEELVGRAEDGFSDVQELTINDIADTQNNLNNFNAFFGQNLSRFSSWLEQPDGLSATSSHADTSLAVRGAAWALLRWSADQFAQGNVPAFTRALVAGPDTGVDNLTAAARVPFDTLMAGWMVANFADNDGITGLDPRNTYLSWNMRSVEAAVNNNVYPLAVTPLDSGQTIMRTMHSGGGDYFQISTAAGTNAVLGVLEPGGAAATFTGARLYVLRTQ